MKGVIMLLALTGTVARHPEDVRPQEFRLGARISPPLSAYPKDSSNLFRKSDLKCSLEEHQKYLFGDNSARQARCIQKEIACQNTADPNLTQYMDYSEGDNIFIPDLSYFAANVIDSLKIDHATLRTASGKIKRCKREYDHCMNQKHRKKKKYKKSN